MAKRRKSRRSAPKAITKYRTRTVTKYRTRSAPKRRGRRRRGGGGGGGGGLMPSRDQMYNMGAAAVFGFIERKAKTDQSFIANTIVSKSPIPQLGFAGNLAVAAKLVNHFAFRHPLLNRFANVTAEIFAYQVGRSGALPASVQPFTVSGEYDEDQLAGDLDVGALAADADAHELDGYDDEISGLDDEMVANVDEGF
jgi:hypothetical protein